MDSRLGLTLPRPDFSTVCSWNGLTWRHDGDHRGFRNPETHDFADVALLGDSIVYGHGVEERDTIAAQLRSRLDLAVANFGLTGASPVHYVAFGQNYALRVRPRALVVVVFANDLMEIPLQRSAEEIRRFSNDGVGRETQILPPNSLARLSPRPGFAPRILQSSFVLRSLLYGVHELSNRSQTAGAETPPERPQTSEFERRFGASAAYLRKALGVLAEDSRRRQSRLVVAYVPSGEQGHALEDEEVPQLLCDSAQEVGYLFIDTTPVLMDGPLREKPGTRLPNDGHLSARGAALVADLLAARLLAAEAFTVPLGTRLSIGSTWVRPYGFWDVESDAAGDFAWTKAESKLEITGLPAGLPLQLSLYVRHVGPHSELAVTSGTGEHRDLVVSANEKQTLPETLRADAQGRLELRLTAQPFRPSDHGPSKDRRALGIALSGIELTAP
jgi:hypothetical protein